MNNELKDYGPTLEEWERDSNLEDMQYEEWRDEE